MALRALVLTFVVIASSAASAYAGSAYFREPFAGVVDGGVVVMPQEVKLFELNAGGRLEPRADWTEAAAREIESALMDELAARMMTAVLYREPVQDADHQRTYRQLVRLHRLVFNTIIVHHLNERQRLPSMNGRFDWSLGPEAATLASDHNGARFALWVSLGDAYSSGGRQALNVAAAIFGGPIISGRQLGYASLVDVRTGDVVWFGRRSVTGTGTADLRTPEGARHAVGDLLEGLHR